MGRPCSEETVTWPEGKSYSTSLSGDASETEAYCGLDRHEIYAYPEWSEIPGHIWSGVVLSALVSLFLQLGTTGAAIVIAYLTPTKGLGCRSAGYLLYGSNATISWILLAVSSFFSHEAMLRYQRDKQKSMPKMNRTAFATSNIATPSDEKTGATDDTDIVNEGIAVSRVRRASNTSFTRSSKHHPNRRSLWHFVPVRGLAAITRYSGKTLAILNAMYLVAICLFEFTGGFDNCWCKVDAIGLGEKGWVVLFRTAIDLKQAASVPWGVGIALSVVVCLLSFGFFWGGM